MKDTYISVDGLECEVSQNFIHIKQTTELGYIDMSVDLSKEDLENLLSIMEELKEKGHLYG